MTDIYMALMFLLLIYILINLFFDNYLLYKYIELKRRIKRRR
ncbi:hypothetical protein LCGC14_2067310 [marine sediment metagenome]|uniref:Uncharacterized protein n=1 Tax=marine sediment metagenome TaxID=412755 RepID=A0A0F9GXX7_9ZZZZ